MHKNVIHVVSATLKWNLPSQVRTTLWKIEFIHTKKLRKKLVKGENIADISHKEKWVDFAEKSW